MPDGARHQPLPGRETGARRGGQFSDELVRDAQRLFEARTGRSVTTNQARVMLHDLTDFVRILSKEERNFASE